MRARCKLSRSTSLSCKVNGARILARQGDRRRREQRGHATSRQDEESSMIREKGAETKGGEYVREC